MILRTRKNIIWVLADSNLFWGNFRRHLTTSSHCVKRHGVFFSLSSRTERCSPEPHRINRKIYMTPSLKRLTLLLTLQLPTWPLCRTRIGSVHTRSAKNKRCLSSYVLAKSPCKFYIYTEGILFLHFPDNVAIPLSMKCRKQEVMLSIILSYRPSHSCLSSVARSWNSRCMYASRPGESQSVQATVCKPGGNREATLYAGTEDG